MSLGINAGSANQHPIVVEFQEKLASTSNPSGEDGRSMSDGEAFALRELAAQAAKAGKDVFDCTHEIWVASGINPYGLTTDYFKQLQKIVGPKGPQEFESSTVTMFRDALIDVMHPNSLNDDLGREYGSPDEVRRVRGLITSAHTMQVHHGNPEVFGAVRDIWNRSEINPNGETSQYIKDLSATSSVKCEKDCK